MNSREIAPYRLKITDAQNFVTYITRDARGVVSYFSGGETPLALSNLLSTRAAETRFCLEDARTGKQAAESLRMTLHAMWKDNLPMKPKVEILS